MTSPLQPQSGRPAHSARWPCRARPLQAQGVRGGKCRAQSTAWAHKSSPHGPPPISSDPARSSPALSLFLPPRTLAPPLLSHTHTYIHLLSLASQLPHS
ncbi:hypothetical protein COCCADRAFT_85063 [Bipolaris zeicola 26-R-13]|uniref:Uncharacterized protein n=1 Tax=Cochliobolus carbonum (strain 26-R-13) TaxID=930089 RepID=W6YQ62_COCC2|nr:uncharacterized protein COCCADRAFT_85063 [Bipolaris zeicola 26-R-13]EUC37614.1 hypothetical protein COCCADRAFT_85063 [Bipolaris zeicola 26-R-13]